MQSMSIIGGKRLETVPVKFSESEKAELQRIAQLADRGVGYIVRELTFRGLAMLRQDGQLKHNDEEAQVIESGLKVPNNKDSSYNHLPIIELNESKQLPILSETAGAGDKRKK